jgi:hypothetical protein
VPSYDVVIASDLAFGGGSSSGALEEIETQHAAGLTTGLYQLASPLVKRGKGLHPGFGRALLDGKCDLVNLVDGVQTKLLLFRHPTVIDHFDGPLPPVAAENVVVVISAPPVDASGKILYLLPYLRSRLRDVYGCEPKLRPVGPLVRAAVDTYYDGEPVLSSEDWLEIFDPTRFHVARDGPRHPIRIGRHSRPDRPKWPASAEAIRAAYPERDDIDVRVLGGAKAPEEILGRIPRNWTVYPFGARAPEDFLREIDVFVYYHHPDWVEAFGRAIIEAMAAGLPSILPPHFAPLVGDAAIYSEPEDVLGWIDGLRDRDCYMDWSRKALLFADSFPRTMHVQRIGALGISPRGPSGVVKESSNLTWLRRRDFWLTSFAVPVLSEEILQVLDRLREWLAVALGETRPQLLVAQNPLPASRGEEFQLLRLVDESATAIAARRGFALRRTVIGGRSRCLVAIPNLESVRGREDDIRRALLEAYCDWATTPLQPRPSRPGAQ